MLLSYVKVPATHYALHFQQGRIRREGLGLSFFYYAPSATIAAIPMGSTDAPFAFVESTADFQQATVQGQLTYRIADPKKVAALLDFSIGPKAQYLADGPLKLQERLVKEASHELGHTFGLRHCADWRCVMASSHGVERLDVKEAEFCAACRKPVLQNGRRFF